MLTRMKRVTVLWGALIFIATIAMLYTMLDTINTFPRQGKTGGESYNLLVSKVVQMEKDIASNNEVIKNIKLELGDVLKRKEEVVHMQLEDGQQTHKPAGDLSIFRKPVMRSESKFTPAVLGPVSTSEGVCEWINEASAETDINTHELLEKLAFDNPDGGAWKQGWKVEYPPDKWNADNKLRIIVVPHTHCDPGWIKTFEDYYRTETKHILDNIVPKLEQNPKYKFMFSEISYFSWWWSEQNLDTKNRVKKLLTNGQFEISTGGWVMTDEANAHYFAMLDQLIEGNQWLNNTLGYTPKSGWSIDPFGYSSTMAYLLKRSNFKSMLIQRVHYSIKKHLAKEKNLEFMWRQHWDKSSSTDIFTHMMPFYSYDVPHTCGPEPAICCQFDFRRLPGSNIRCPWHTDPKPISGANIVERSATILDQWKKKATLYKTDVLLVPLGDDFRYLKMAEFDAQFGNYERIFEYLEKHPEMGATAEFGTLSDYFNTLHAHTGTKLGEAPKGIPSLSGDFFSYADRDDHYWTGYFTSRPLQKNLDRVVENNIRSAEIIFSLAQATARQHQSANFPSRVLMEKMVEARRTLGLFQHHDAITGTAKDFVVVDYGKRLLKALENTKTVIGECSTFLLAKSKTDYTFSETDRVFNHDKIRHSHDSMPSKPILILSTEPKSILLYNSLAQPRVEVVNIWVSSQYVEVKDKDGKVIHSQVEPFWMDNGNIATDRFKVSFTAELSGLSLAVYTIRQVESGQDTLNHLVNVRLRAESTMHVDGGHFEIQPESSMADFDLETNFLKATFSGSTGLLKKVKVLASGSEFKSEMELIQYGTKMAKERSGAYLFLPDGKAKPLLTQRPSLIRIVRGPIVSEVQVLTQHIKQTVRLHNTPGQDGMSVDVSNVVDIQGTHNKEVGMRIHTNIDNTQRIFYSDLNGFQMQRRKYHDKLTLQGNVYPMPTMTYIQDGKHRMSIVSSQSSGVANVLEGALDVMFDRRLNQDDNRGLGQGVLDNRVTPSRYRILFEDRVSVPKNVQPETSFPSLMAQSASLSLIHPIFAMPQAGKAMPLPLLPSLPLIQESLSCDIHLFNLRAMKHSDDDQELDFVPKESSLLLLRQLPTDCSITAPSLACQTSSKGQIVLDKLFTDLTVKQSKWMSLTLTQNLGEFDPKSPVEVSPMEVLGLQITLS